MRTADLVGLAALSFKHRGSDAMLAILGVLVTVGDVETGVEFLLDFSNAEASYRTHRDSINFGATASSSARVNAGVCRCRRVLAVFGGVAGLFERLRPADDQFLIRGILFWHLTLYVPTM